MFELTTVELQVELIASFWMVIEPLRGDKSPRRRGVENERGTVNSINIGASMDAASGLCCKQPCIRAQYPHRSVHYSTYGTLLQSIYI